MPDECTGERICAECGAIWTAKRPIAKRPALDPAKALAAMPADAHAVADALCESISAFNPAHPIVRPRAHCHERKWWPDLDKLQRLDGVSWERQRAVCQWMAEGRSEAAVFRRSTVLSAAKLRKHFGALEGLMHKDGYTTPERQAELDAKDKAVTEATTRASELIFARADVRDMQQGLLDAKEAGDTGSIKRWKAMVARAEMRLTELERGAS